MFVQDSSRELDISNGNLFFNHLSKCQPSKKINTHNKQLSFECKTPKKIFVKFDSNIPILEA